MLPPIAASAKGRSTKRSAGEFRTNFLHTVLYLATCRPDLVNMSLRSAMAGGAPVGADVSIGVPLGVSTDTPPDFTSAWTTVGGGVVSTAASNFKVVTFPVQDGAVRVFVTWDSQISAGNATATAITSVSAALEDALMPTNTGDPAGGTVTLINTGSTGTGRCSCTVTSTNRTSGSGRITLTPYATFTAAVAPVRVEGGFATWVAKAVPTP